MALKTSEVYRCLEKKTLIFGFELLDLFAVFALLALLNFVFAGIRYKFAWTWGPAALLAVLLRVGKSGKPENYLLHLARYHLAAGVLPAFPLAGRRSRFVHFKERGGRHVRSTRAKA